MKTATLIFAIFTFVGCAIILGLVKETNNLLPVRDKTIDSLKHELEFHQQMNIKFIENNETDPIGVRVEVRKNMKTK